MCPGARPPPGRAGTQTPPSRAGSGNDTHVLHAHAQKANNERYLWPSVEQTACFIAISYASTWQMSLLSLTGALELYQKGCRFACIVLDL